MIAGIPIAVVLALIEGGGHGYAGAAAGNVVRPTLPIVPCGRRIGAGG